MENVSLICIGCPLGCSLTARMEGREVVSVTGNTCPNGEKYARRELTHPTRIVTSTVRVKGGDRSVVPVKTACDIPKDRIFRCMEQLQAVEIAAPVAAGQVILQDVAGTGVALVATKSVEAAG